MTALRPWEAPPTGPAAAVADRFAALVPVIETERFRLRALRTADHDGCQVWVHHPVARNAVSTRVETQGRRDEDAKKMRHSRPAMPS